MRARSEHGAASVEHVGLVVLIALLAMAAIAALVGAPPTEEARRLGSQLDRRIRCPARLPDPCWRDPLTDAYGRPLGGLVRALAPRPQPMAGPAGPELPVDFRYCRTGSCAMPGDEAGLTASNRRVTAFTSVADHRRSGGGVDLSYWLYRPGLGWDGTVREASSQDVERYASTPLLGTANPVLVPLETLYGRDHYDFPPGEEPPWRWKVQSVYPG
jgi:hypothetical protein